MQSIVHLVTTGDDHAHGAIKAANKQRGYGPTLLVNELEEPALASNLYLRLTLTSKHRRLNSLTVGARRRSLLLWHPSSVVSWKSDFAFPCCLATAERLHSLDVTVRCTAKSNTKKTQTKCNVYQESVFLYSILGCRVNHEVWNTREVLCLHARKAVCCRVRQDSKKKKSAVSCA